MAKIFSKSKLKDFLNFLGQKYHILAPVKKEKHFLFEIINPFSDIPQIEKTILNYPTTIIPPTKFFFKTADPIWAISQKKIERIFETKPVLLFGVHLYDAKAFDILDKVLKKDPVWRQRRKKSLIIAVRHQPRVFHFEETFLEEGIPNSVDIFLEKTGEHWIAFAISEKGKVELAQAPGKTVDWQLRIKPKTDSVFPWSFSALEKIITLDNPGWDDLVKRCIMCGICSYVCPVCYCFDIKDKVDLATKKVTRERHWTSCMLQDFAQTGNKVKSPKERIFNWYYHKFVRFPKEFGTLGCVGCGRCIKFCPAKIDFRKEIEKLAKPKK